MANDGGHTEPRNYKEDGMSTPVSLEEGGVKDTGSELADTTVDLHRCPPAVPLKEKEGP